MLRTFITIFLLAFSLQLVGQSTKVLVLPDDFGKIEVPAGYKFNPSFTYSNGTLKISTKQSQALLLIIKDKNGKIVGEVYSGRTTSITWNLSDIGGLSKGSYTVTSYTPYGDSESWNFKV